MRKTIEISNAERLLIKKAFSLYGSIKPLTEKTGVSRDALKRLIVSGKATEEVVQKVRSFLNSKSKTEQP